MLKLVKGRPQDESGRLEKEIRVYDLLDELQIPYERVDHEVAETMEACKRLMKYWKLISAKIFSSAIARKQNFIF